MVAETEMTPGSFWVPDPVPVCQPLLDWCEAEVKTACEDLVAHLFLDPDSEPDAVAGITVSVDVGSPWDLDLSGIAMNASRISLVRLINEFASWHATLDGTVDGEIVDPPLKILEQAIASIRLRYGDLSGGA